MCLLNTFSTITFKSIMIILKSFNNSNLLDFFLFTIRLTFTTGVFKKKWFQILFKFTYQNKVLFKIHQFFGIIRGKLNFNKYNQRCNTFFKEKLITRCFVRYIGRTSSRKNNTQCTMHLKAKNKTNEHSGERRHIQQQFNNFVQQNNINLTT